MNYQVVLLGLSIHALFWEHLPHWGTWFNRLLSSLPTQLQSLYELWRCPYCAGFWIALSLHATTGIWTWPALADLPSFWGPAGVIVGWILDALLTAIGIKLATLALHATSLPAMRAVMMKPDFMAYLTSKPSDTETVKG